MKQALHNDSAEIQAEKTIGKADIEDIISKIARIPPQTVNQDDRSAIADHRS